MNDDLRQYSDACEYYRRAHAPQPGAVHCDIFFLSVLLWRLHVLLARFWVSYYNHEHSSFVHFSYPLLFVF